MLFPTRSSLCTALVALQTHEDSLSRCEWTEEHPVFPVHHGRMVPAYRAALSVVVRIVIHLAVGETLQKRKWASISWGEFPPQRRGDTDGDHLSCLLQPTACTDSRLCVVSTLKPLCLITTLPHHCWSPLLWETLGADSSEVLQLENEAEQRLGPRLIPLSRMCPVHEDTEFGDVIKNGDIPLLI